MAIDFTPSWLDAELRLVQDTAVRFIETELQPHDERDRDRGHVGHEVWRKAGALGLLCSDIPDAYGGGGGDFRHEAVFYDALARRALTGLGVQVHSIAAHYLFNHGTEDQKRRFLPRLASGELVGAIAMSEPAAGSDLQGIRARAERSGGDYVLNGSKTFISNGYLAGLVLVVCRTSSQPGAQSISILIVETAESQGFGVGKVLKKIGMKSQDTSEMFFCDVRVPAENLIGGVEGKGFAQLMSDLPYERVGVGVVSVAAMEGAYEAALAHVRERHAFGKPLAEFQNTKYKLAETATSIHVARTFLDRCVVDLVAGAMDATHASMVKLWLSEQSGRVIDDCLQLFGGYGVMSEYLVSRLYTDARVFRIYGGTSEIMKEVISRAL